MSYFFIQFVDEKLYFRLKNGIVKVFKEAFEFVDVIVVGFNNHNVFDNCVNDGFRSVGLFCVLGFFNVRLALIPTLLFGFKLGQKCQTQKFIKLDHILEYFLQIVSHMSRE